jgi:hypothetical protein
MEIGAFLPSDGSKNMTLQPECPQILCAMDGAVGGGPRILLAGNSLMIKYSSSIVEALAGRFSMVGLSYSTVELPLRITNSFLCKH